MEYRGAENSTGPVSACLAGLWGGGRIHIFTSISLRLSYNLGRYAYPWFTEEETRIKPLKVL